MSVSDKALQQTMQDQTKRKVAWKNASPTSEFDEQTIYADMSDGDVVVIEFNESVQNAQTYFDEIRVPIQPNAKIKLEWMYNFNSSSLGTARRLGTISEDLKHITFGLCGIKAMIAVNATPDYTQFGKIWGVPIAIYVEKIIGGGYRLATTLLNLLSIERRCVAWQ